MSTTTDRAAELREEIANTEALKAMAYGTPLYHTYVARQTKAKRELAEVEVR
ncbi:MAG: hypothetical protein ACRDQD_00605 [Nocardioidaceae bacterium]